MGDLISIKGGKDGIRVQLDEAAEWHSVLAALRTQFDQGGSFFAGARLLVDVGERPLNDTQLTEILALMEQHGVEPEALAATARESRNAARSAGLRARVTSPAPALQNQTNSDETGLLLVRTVRSGQVIRHHGHVTLIGDVNAGAEIIAAGSVIVWGRLRGMVHAGALGDHGALICALELRPTQLRIASLIARTPEDVNRQKLLPEVARIDDEHIVVEAWDAHIHRR
jgi:septum site-determining protein MinC